MLNKTSIIGRVGEDAVHNTTREGKEVTNFSFVNNESYYDKKNDKWETITTWYQVEVWGKSAKRVAERATKGRLVYLEGKVRLHKWTGSDSVERHDLVLRLTHFEPLDKAKKENSINEDTEPPIIISENDEG